MSFTTSIFFLQLSVTVRIILQYLYLSTHSFSFFLALIVVTQVVLDSS